VNTQRADRMSAKNLDYHYRCPNVYFADLPVLHIETMPAEDIPGGVAQFSIQRGRAHDHHS
jgi:hypothetical protein